MGAIASRSFSKDRKDGKDGKDGKDVKRSEPINSPEETVPGWSMTDGVRVELLERLTRIQPDHYRVVSCYLKLEPRDRSRGKYLIKLKNRIKAAVHGAAPAGPGPRHI